MRTPIDMVHVILSLKHRRERDEWFSAAYGHKGREKIPHNEERFYISNSMDGRLRPDAYQSHE